MTSGLHVERVGPSVSVQDLGRVGWMANGLSPGGSMDPFAILEAAALLGQSSPLAALEMAGIGGSFEFGIDTRIALTGAVMTARLGDAALVWNATHLVRAGQRLTIGAAEHGTYGYLSFAGGVGLTKILGGRGAHISVGLGALVQPEQTLAIDPDPDPEAAPVRLQTEDRFSGGEIRVMPGPQTGLFPDNLRDRFENTQFRRSLRGDRQGVKLEHEGDGFAVPGQLDQLSDMIVAGDVQVTGDGTPFVLMAECQTIGGYPRIGTVLPADLPRVAQAAPGTALTFRFVSVEHGDASAVSIADQLRQLRGKVAPLVRDVHRISDLLSYQLISGVTAGQDLDFDQRPVNRKEAG